MIANSRVKTPWGRGKKQKAFTMIEFLVAAIILGLIAGFALVTYEKVMERANIRQATLNLKAIHAASYAFRARNGSFPNIQCGDYSTDCVGLINSTLGTHITHGDMIYSYNFKNAAYPDATTFTAEATRVTPFYSLQVTQATISAANPTWCEGNDWP